MGTVGDEREAAAIELNTNIYVVHPQVSTNPDRVVIFVGNAKVPRAPMGIRGFDALP